MLLVCYAFVFEISKRVHPLQNTTWNNALDFWSRALTVPSSNGLWFFKNWILCNYPWPQLGTQHKITTWFGLRTPLAFFLLSSRTGWASRMTIVPWHSRVRKVVQQVSWDFSLKSNMQLKICKRKIRRRVGLRKYTVILMSYYKCILSFCVLVQALLKPSLLMEC